MVCQGSGAGILASVGTATAQIFGEDIGREVSKAVLITSGRIFSGAVTVVFGGATMIYGKNINEKRGSFESNPFIGFYFEDPFFPTVNGPGTTF